MFPAIATRWAVTAGTAATLLLGLVLTHSAHSAHLATVQTATVQTLPIDNKPGKENCGPLDIDCKISNALDDWFRNLAKSAIKTVFNGLGKGLIQTPRVDQVPRVGEIWTQTDWVANTCFVLFVIAGGLLVMGHETIQTSSTVKDIAPRLVVAMVAANFSLSLVGHAIEFANQLALSLIGPGVDAEQAMRTLGKRMSTNVATGPLFFVLLTLAAISLAVLLAIVYALRVTITILLVCVGPLAMLCHALPQTEELAKLWWRAVAGVLAIQSTQALVFVVAIKVMFTPDPQLTFSGNSQLWDLLIALCLLYVLIRIPAWVAMQVWTGGMRRSPITHFYRYVANRHMIGRSVRRNTRRHPR